MKETTINSLRSDVLIVHCKGEGQSEVFMSDITIFFSDVWRENTAFDGITKLLYEEVRHVFDLNCHLSNKRNWPIFRSSYLVFLLYTFSGLLVAAFWQQWIFIERRGHLLPIKLFGWATFIIYELWHSFLRCHGRSSDVISLLLSGVCVWAMRTMLPQRRAWASQNQSPASSLPPSLCQSGQPTSPLLNNSP